MQAALPSIPTTPLKIWSVIPPMTQLNTPYPSSAYLTGFLREHGFAATQTDLALQLVLALFTEDGLARMRAQCEAQLPEKRSASVHAFLDQYEDYAGTVALVIAFLQGRDNTLAHRIASRSLLPEGPRFAALDENANALLGGEEDDYADTLVWAFGALGTLDKARHIATLYLNDLADVIKHAVDARFEFVRYGEQLASSQSSFDTLASALAAPHGLIDELLHSLTMQAMEQQHADVVLLSIPFPGSVYGALRIAQSIKAARPKTTIVLGGGFVNTELRELSDARLFDYVDFITLDAGERPLLALLEHLQGKRSAARLVRTFMRSEDGEVVYRNLIEPEVPFDAVGTPTYDGLPIHDYLSLLDMLNPMHRLWSDGRWNKLTVALGCYWKKCSFCDVSLDYISRYEVVEARMLVDRIERMVLETGQTGFHFVDEAAPPKVLKALAQELLQRKVNITWWGNIRFEKTFTPELCELLAQSGCIAMSGGLEVASDRLLGLMNKGVTVEQVAQVTKAFSDCGILVHAYLMYGFPTQTVQETVDALEYVRQLFTAGCIQSGFFHRFACTAHSPVGLKPSDFGITLETEKFQGFAKNTVHFIDPTGVDHDALGIGLRKALYNYMHGIGTDTPAHTWFDHLPEAAPKTTVNKRFIAKALR